MIDKSAGIYQQDRSYRRGLVLGLTMAEIMILILFSILLATAASFEQKEKKIQGQKNKIESMTNTFNKLFEKNPRGIKVKDILQVIERQKFEIRTLEKKVDTLKPAATAGKEVVEILKRLYRQKGVEPTPKQISEDVVKLSESAKTLATQRGQIKQLSRQIKETGRGNAFPSCWVTEGGKIESIFEILFSSDGITVKARNLPHRTVSVHKLPLSRVVYNTPLSISLFKNSFAPLFKWSRSEKCRFYVIRYSAGKKVSGADVNAVNGYFYPDTSLIYQPQ